MPENNSDLVRTAAVLRRDAAGLADVRRQYKRIVAAPKLIINARANMTFTQRPFRARSCMRRYDSGLLVLSRWTSSPVGQGEWIAHEFEHVLEQLDGLRLPAMASRGSPDT